MTPARTPSGASPPAAGVSRAGPGANGLRVAGARIAGSWRVADFGSGVPRVPVSDSVVGWSQPLLTTALVVLSALTITPLGLRGRGAFGLLLLIACGVFGYLRSVPDRFVPMPGRFALALVAAGFAGLLFGFDGNSWGVGFAYLVCGHAGFRFRQLGAGIVCALCVLVCLLTLLAHRHDPDVWPLWTAFTVCLPVLTGFARQNRERTLHYANELIEQTQRATESERQASALAERTRVARDIHDVLAHALSGVSMQLDLADALLESGRIEQGRESVQAARGLVVDGLVEARRAVQALRDGALEVGDSLSRMVQPGEELRLRGDLTGLDAAVAQGVVRIVQEALTNVRRHAPGAPAVVEVTHQDDALTVDVVNARAQAGGPMNSEGSGMGLVGLRERVADLGGTCRIRPETSGPYAGGWRVQVELPVRQGDPL